MCSESDEMELIDLERRIESELHQLQSFDAIMSSKHQAQFSLPSNPNIPSQNAPSSKYPPSNVPSSKTPPSRAHSSKIPLYESNPISCLSQIKELNKDNKYIGSLMNGNISPLKSKDNLIFYHSSSKQTTKSPMQQHSNQINILSSCQLPSQGWGEVVPSCQSENITAIQLSNKQLYKSTNNNDTMKENRGNLHTAKTRKKSVNIRQEDSECTFKPILSKKSMEIAMRMQDKTPLYDNTQKEQKLKKMRESFQNQYSFHPLINKTKENIENETTSHENDDENQQRARQISVSTHQTVKSNSQYISGEYSFNSTQEQNQMIDTEQLYNTRQQNICSSDQGQTKFIMESEQQNLIPKAPKVPRWKLLYDNHKTSQINKEMYAMQKEKEELENEQFTFQPKVNKTKNTQLMHFENNYDISTRSQIWAQKRKEKILQVAQQFENKDLQACTFYPSTYQRKDHKNINRSSSPISQINNDLQTTNNKTGTVSQFERGEVAKKKQEDNQVNPNQQHMGLNWQNRVTVPQEFSFMTRTDQNTSPIIQQTQQVNPRSTISKSQSTKYLQQNSTYLSKERSINYNNINQSKQLERKYQVDIPLPINNLNKIKGTLRKDLLSMDI